MAEDEATKELRKMVAFIMQEASEKSREIHVKADEEFNIEKAKLVHQETTAIEQQFERKIKQTEIRRKIMQSNQINKSRLKVLQAQDSSIEEIMEEAKRRLSSIPTSSSYTSTLSALMLQSFFRFMDGSELDNLSISVRVRKEDLAMAQKALEQAQTEFRQSTGRSLKSASIDESNWLHESSLGGIVASSMNGRIILENTLASRLELAAEALLPVIRSELFGASETRKFFD